MATNKEMLSILLDARNSIEEIYLSHIADLVVNETRLSNREKLNTLKRLKEERTRVLAELDARIEKVMSE